MFIRFTARLSSGTFIAFVCWNSKRVTNGGWNWNWRLEVVCIKIFASVTRQTSPNKAVAVCSSPSTVNYDRHPDGNQSTIGLFMSL